MLQEDDPHSHPPWRTFTRYLTSVETERLFPVERHKREFNVTLQFQVRVWLMHCTMCAVALHDGLRN
jgi:hypothetical protein